MITLERKQGIGTGLVSACPTKNINIIAQLLVFLEEW